MTTHRSLQLANLMDSLQVNRIRWHNAARGCASLGNKNGMGFYLAKTKKASQIIERICVRFGERSTT